MKQSPDFDSIKHLNPYSIEYWSARDLMPLLGYGKNWQNFSTAIQKAMVSCRENGQVVEHHFNASIKMEEKLRRDTITGEDRAIQTHYFVGDQVRKTLETLQAPMPETLPSAPSIRKMVEARRRTAKKRKLRSEHDQAAHTQDILFSSDE